jgi:hypothetical protein
MPKLIQAGDAAKNPITHAERLDILHDKHGIAIFSDTLRHLIRSLDSMKSVIWIAIEAERVAVDSEDMNA